MKNIITPRSTIPYLYGECSAEEEADILLARITQASVYRELEELKQIVSQIDNCLLEPNYTTVQNILEYAKRACA